MLINKTIETPEGIVEFKGNLLDEELDFVIEVGLNVILAQGATNFLSDKSKRLDNLNTSSGETH